MTSGQPQILIATTPGNMTGTVISQSTVGQGHMQPFSAMSPQEKRELQFYTRVSMGLVVIGSLSIVLGVGVLTTGFVALFLGSVLEYGFTFLWGGFVFAIINGALAIKASKISPHIDKHWCRVLLGFGSTTLVLHVVDLIICCISAAIYDNEYYTTTRCPPSSAYCYSYYTYMVTATTSEAPRLTMLLMLLTLEICELVAAAKSIKMLSTQSVLQSDVTTYINGQQQYTVIQTPMTMQMQMPTSYVVVPAMQANTATPAAVFLQTAVPTTSMGTMNQSNVNNDEKDGNYAPPPYRVD